MIKKRDIQFASLGNGLSVYDRNTMQGGDYKTIAHIDRYRKITWYEKNLEPEDKALIEHQANTADPNISITQDQKVFLTRPKGE